MAVRSLNMRYSMREAVELILNEGSDVEHFSEDFSDCSHQSEENIVDSGEDTSSTLWILTEIHLELSIFVFIIGIQATRRIKLFVTVFG